MSSKKGKIIRKILGDNFCPSLVCFCSPGKCVTGHFWDKMYIVLSECSGSGVGALWFCNAGMLILSILTLPTYLWIVCPRGAMRQRDFC